jgi:tripartite-type tricarboxylate transporter receptor subunit TctC
MQRKAATLVFVAALAVGELVTLYAAQAQEIFPTRTVTIVSPFTPGSAPDVTARLVAPLLAEKWGKPVIVENRAGANGNIAMAAVARATPDGYTLVMAPDTTFCINPTVYANANLNPRRDFSPVASVAGNQFVLLVSPSLPSTTLAEFAAYARDAKPPLLYGSIGVGSLHHLAMEMLKKRTGIPMTHVPYRGGMATLTGVVAGEVQVTFSGAASAGLLSSGKLRALAISGSKRSKAFPDLPTVSETYPDFEINAWMGLFAPAGTPAPLLAKLRDDVRSVLREPAFLDRLNVSGNLEPLDLDIPAFSKMIDSDCEKYSEVVREVGIKLE